MKSLLVGAVSAGVLVATAGIASAQDAPPPMKVQTGPDAEVTVDGLHRVDNSLMALAYVKPDMNLQGYTRRSGDRCLPERPSWSPPLDGRWTGELRARSLPDE
jgi:hypothetical protein